MQYAYAKREARRERYKLRARTARFYARLVMLALLVTIAAAAWQDETYGPQMRQYALIAMEKFEEATDEGSAGRKLVQTAISKLEL
ncbi:hypothetical protein [Roseovarius aestuarii]|uniref:Uncharacterized protein n=2 Tax=Roseovarius aestuarii TaxID=475083 RepID=A0A1X7BLT9_9RHOB|nr:hypothetical protein [Roseovarius aestuarii]SMC10586.1 hypothetical protein ROA7745_00393 [Roseovarius aestuarii]